MIVEDGKLKTDDQVMNEYINDTVVIENIKEGEILQIEESWEFHDQEFEIFFNDIYNRLS